jgi:hypothetical protein
MVSIANRHQVLTTDQKRFLIGLRMAEVHTDGTYRISSEKVGKFNRIFGQFLNELKPGQRCDKTECPTCDRLQDLLVDFHGTQESTEFQRFIDWFQKSTLVYTNTESDSPATQSPRVLTSPFAGGKPSVSVPAATSACHGLPTSALTGPFESAPHPRPEPVEAAQPTQSSVPAVCLVRPIAEAAETSPDIFPAFPENLEDIPLFLPNENHPLVRQLIQLGQANIQEMGEKKLREHALQLQLSCQRLLGSLGIKNDAEAQPEPRNSVTA